MAKLAGVAQDDHERGGEAELGGNLRPAPAPPAESFSSYFLPAESTRPWAARGTVFRAGLMRCAARSGA